MSSDRSNIPKPLLRLSEIVRPDGCLPIGKSSWWAGVKAGKFPKPIKLGPKISAWKAEDIEHLINNGID